MGNQKVVPMGLGGCGGLFCYQKGVPMGLRQNDETDGWKDKEGDREVVEEGKGREGICGGEGDGDDSGGGEYRKSFKHR